MTMKKSLMDILCDLLDKNELELEVNERGSNKITEGWLVSMVADEVYPVEDSTPDLLPPDMRGD